MSSRASEIERDEWSMVIHLSLFRSRVFNMIFVREFRFVLQLCLQYILHTTALLYNIYIVLRANCCI